MIRKDKWEKTIEFAPAYDKRHSDPNKNYGICAVLFKFILKKDNKAVQFMWGTDWYLPKTVKAYKKEGIHGRLVSLRGKHDCGISGWDIGYHSPTPMFEEHEPAGKCDYIKGKCYTDGSSLYAQDNEAILIEQGSEGVWKFLKKYWKETFEKSSLLSDSDNEGET